MTSCLFLCNFHLSRRALSKSCDLLAWEISTLDVGCLAELKGRRSLNFSDAAKRI
jgi:hypothetical protein